jgi:hypothetical protein
MATGPDTHLRWVERLERAAKSGALLDLAGDSPCDPRTAGTWGDERTIPGAALREVLMSPNLDVHPVGLRIRGVRIKDLLDLAYVTLSYPLELRDCSIEDNFIMLHTVVKELTVSGTHIRMLALDGAEISGTLFADNSVVEGFVRAVGTRIGGQLQLSGARFANAGGDALVLDGAEISGTLFADNSVVEGFVRAVGTRIGGDLNLSGATLICPGGNALILDFVEIAGALRAAGLKNRGGLSAVGAHVGRNVVLDGARLFNTHGDALMLDGAEIGGAVFAREGFRARGKVSANSAHFGHQLILSGASFANPPKNGLAQDAIELDGAVIGTVLAADDGFRAEGRVHAVAARVGVDLRLSGANFYNPGGDALTLDGAEIGHSLFANNGFRAEGTVNARGARIGGQVVLAGGTFTAGLLDAIASPAVNDGRGEPALSNSDGPSAEKSTRREPPIVVNLEGAQMAGLIPGGTRSAPKPAIIDGIMRLRRAVIDDLNGPATGWLAATGWEIKDVSGNIRTNRRAAADWLKTALAGEPSVQPWHALAAVYDRNGQPAAARLLRLAAAVRVTRKAPWPTKLMRAVYLGVVGHGYYPLLAGVWLLVAVILGTALVANNRAEFVPTNIAAADKAAADYAQQTKSPVPIRTTAATSCNRHPDYPCLNPLTYTVSTMVPTVGTTASDWVLRSDAASWLTIALIAVKLVAWALGVLLLAGVTGLLQKT